MGFEHCRTCAERQSMEWLADKVMEYNLGIMENHARFPGQIHGFSFTDDWGTSSYLCEPQDGTVFKPRYKVLFDSIRQGLARVDA